MTRILPIVLVVVVVAACGGAAKPDPKTSSSDNKGEEKKDEVGSIGELAAAKGGLASLGGAGNREEGGATGSEVAMSGTLKAEKSGKRAPIKVDGLLGEWSPRAPAKETIAGKTDGLSLDVGVMYDNDNLYIGAEVTDPKGSRSGKHLENEDHVSMTIAFPSGRRQLSAYEVGFWAGKPGASMGAVKWLAGPNKALDIPGSKIVESDTKGGYVFEAVVPWSSFPEARTQRVGLRAAFRYHSMDGGVKGVLATGPGGLDKPNDLAPLPTNPEQAVVEGLLNQKNLAGEKPKIDIYADVAGDEQKERISVFGKFFTICGPGYRKGHQFFWRDSGAEIVSIEARDVTGRGKEDLVVRKRYVQPSSTHDVLEVWALIPADEPVTVFAQEIAIVSTDGKRKVTNSARISQKEIEIGVEPAVGWDAASFKEQVSGDVEPILLPWGTVKSRTYRLDKNKFAKASEVAQEGRAAAGASAEPALAKDTSAPRVTPSSDTGKKIVDAYYKDAGVAPGTKPKFDFEVQKHRVLLVGKDIVALGPSIGGGTGYTRITMTQFGDEKDVSEVTARDLVGDGGLDIVVRGTRHVNGVDVQALFIYAVKGGNLMRVFSIETGREQSGNRVQGLVQFVPAKSGKGFDITAAAGGAKGWTEKTYPWPQEKSGGAIEPLILPWSKLPPVRYAWNGTEFARAP